MFPALLRLLLCLCLLVDAVAPAVAATHMAITAVGASPAAAEATGDPGRHGTDGDCHAMRAAPTVDGTPAAAAPAQDDDCLQRCLDLCLQSVVASPPTTTMLPAAGPASAPATKVPGRLHAPRAFPPLRPPIA